MSGPSCTMTDVLMRADEDTFTQTKGPPCEDKGRCPQAKKKNLRRNPTC